MLNKKGILLVDGKRIEQISLLIFILNIFALSYIFGISFHSRLLGDDLVINSDIEKFNSLQYVSHVYNTWTGRFTAVFVQYYFFLLYNQFNSVFINVVLLYLFGWFSICRFLNLFISDILQFQVFNISFFILNVLILSSLEIYTIFWVTSQVYYFNVFVLFFLFSFIFKANISKIELFLIIVFSFYVGGIGEHISPLYFVFLLYLLVFKSFSRYINTNLVLSLCFGFLSFIILLLAPGNLVRISYSTPSSSVSLIQNSLFVILKMIVFVSFKSFYFLVLFCVFHFLGSYVKKENVLSLNIWIFPTNFNFKNKFNAFFVFFLFFVLTQLPAVFVISNSLPRWSSIHLNFIIILFTIYFSFNSGYYSNFNHYKFGFLLTKVLLVFLILTISYFFYNEYSIVKVFSYNYDINILFLDNLNSCHTKYNSIFSEALEMLIGKDRVEELLIYLHNIVYVPNTINVSNENKYFDFFLFRSPFYCQ
jgi:hypothetical protein